jgi:thiamine transporter ThiT
MKNFSIWLKLCVFNFFVVSVVGVMMRYNMAFSFLGLTHKFTQEAHSHFAFYGWVSASIYLFVTKYLSESPKK